MLLLTSEFTDGNESCTSELMVKRNSKAEVLSADSLKIDCPVKYCYEKPTVGWCKVADSGDECIPVNQTDAMEILWRDTEEKTGILTLYFKHIAMNDSGLYRCHTICDTGVCTSHSINVTVQGKF